MQTFHFFSLLLKAFHRQIFRSAQSLQKFQNFPFCSFHSTVPECLGRTRDASSLTDASGNEITTVFLCDCHMFMIDYRYKFSSSSSHIQPFIDNLIDVYFEFYLIFALLDFEAGRKIVFTYESEAAADFFLCKKRFVCV